MKRLLAAILVCVAAALPQTNRGGLSGTVFDPTGAVVPAATVVITNLGTNQTLRLAASEAGAYAAANLDPVSYRIEVEAPLQEGRGRESQSRYRHHRHRQRHPRSRNG